MSSQPSSPAGLPPVMGPGARPVQQGESPGSIIKEISDMRSHYSVSLDSTSLSIAYDLNGAPRHYSIPFESIPLGRLSRSLLFGGTNRTKVSGTYVIDAVRGAENMTGQALSQREVEGFALHSSKRLMYMYAGAFSALGLGASMAWYGRKDMKFPFLKPRPPERYDFFPSKGFALLKGNQSRVMWHITRGNVYAAIGIFLLNPVFNTMGDTSMMVGLYRDERTRDVVKSMKGSFDRIRSNRPRAGQAGQQAPQPQGQQQEQTQDLDPNAYYRDTEKGMANDYSGGRDYSRDDSYIDDTTDTGMLTDAAMSQPEAEQSSPTSFSTSPRRPEPAQQPRDQRQHPDFFFDDASPTAGNRPDASASGSNQSSGSAWERIRRGVTNQPAPSRTPATSSRPMPARRAVPQRNENETSGDSFSFSNNDEERELAKAQAQKEFDAMLDRERRESGSGDYVRDMNATEGGRDSATASAWGRRRGN